MQAFFPFSQPRFLLYVDYYVPIDCVLYHFSSTYLLLRAMFAFKIGVRPRISIKCTKSKLRPSFTHPEGVPVSHSKNKTKAASAKSCEAKKVNPIGQMQVMMFNGSYFSAVTASPEIVILHESRYWS